MHRTPVLIIDDDDLLRQSLAEQLSAEGFAVVEAASGATALALLAERPIDAILLAAPLADGAGGELCRALRDHGISVPILLMIGGINGHEAAGLAAAAGADDHVVKPLRVGQILGRLRACLQRQQGETSAFRIGPFTFQPAEKLLVDGQDRRIALTDKEVAILRYLHRAGRMIAREVLLNAVWGYGAGVSTHTLETHVYRLRRKMEADPANARILVTEPGGYRLIP